MRKYRNQLLVGLGIIFVIYLGLLLVTNTQELLDNLRAFPWILLLPLLLLKLIAWGLRFIVWHYYLGVVGGSAVTGKGKISLTDSLIIFVAGWTLVVSPGKIAEVLKAVVVKAKSGIPVSRGVPVVIAERVIDAISVLVVTFLAVLLAGDQINLGPYRGLIFVTTGLLILALVAIQIGPLAYFCLNIAAKIPLVRRIHRELVEFYESSREILKLRHIIPMGIIGATAYAVDGFVFTIILSGFGLPVTWLLFLQTSFIVGFTSALGAVSGSPNGAGVTEVSTGGMLIAMISPQYPEITLSVAAAAVLIEAFFYKWLRVFVGLVVGLIFRRRLFSPAVEETLAEMESQRGKGPAYQTKGSTIS